MTPLLRACRALLFLLVIADAMSPSSRLAQQIFAIGFFCLLTSFVLRGNFQWSHPFAPSTSLFVKN